MTHSVPAPRCCTSHDSWPELVQHLVAGFPQISTAEVLDIVYRARRAEEDFGLPEAEHLRTAEVIARHEILQRIEQQMSPPTLVPDDRD
jgi:hypothetical protein